MTTQLEKVEPLIRNKMRKFLFLLILIATENCFSQTSLFDKKKWQTSSDYRYEIIKSKDFPTLERKTKKQIKKILGEPNFISDKDYTYCLDIPEKNENLSKCKGPLLVISIDKSTPEKYKVTIIWVD